jgi:hypothetical protein
MKIKFSCVVDRDIKFQTQALIWLFSLLGSKTAKAEDVVIHVIGENEEFENVVSALGVAVVKVESKFTGDSAYCNKLLQLDTPLLLEADTVVFCDTDIAFCHDISPFLEPINTVCAKLVDCTNPPLEILNELFAQTGLDCTPEIHTCQFDSGKSFKLNCNGGFYVIPTKYLSSLADKWKKWAEWLLEQKNLLGEYLKHADQMGFCFAMLELDIPYEALDLKYNFPMHLPPETFVGITSAPYVLHFHWLVDPHGLIENIGNPLIDSAINIVNDFIIHYRRQGYSNKIFWDFRYRYHKDLGSGVGSRGENISIRRDVIYPLLEKFGKKSILDVGCGDLELLKDATLENYLGIDLSEHALNLCMQKRPDWDFKKTTAHDLEGQFDVVICSHVLIHQPTVDFYNALITSLVDRCCNTLLVEAYDEPPHFTSDITYYYEPITQSLQRDSRITSIKNIGECRDTAIIIATVNQKKGLKARLRALLSKWEKSDGNGTRKGLG